MTSSPDRFQSLVDQIFEIGKAKHGNAILEHARNNLQLIGKTLRDLPPPSGKKAGSAVVISAGPSLHMKKSIQRIKDSGFDGTIIAADAAYIACLRNGLIPDYVVTLDPHPTRMVRWFGDPDYEQARKFDDYFERQDLDIEFRKNSIETNKRNIELVNRFGAHSKAIVASSAPKNVCARLREAGFDLFWWNPLVDDPSDPASLTRQLYSINRLPSMNTGGNVGTASWVFAATMLKIPRVGLVGMDYGYYHELPRSQTQTYYELAAHFGSDSGIEDLFLEFAFPLTGEKFYTDPTYYWYRRNFLQLLAKAPASTKTFNCTEGGTLFGQDVRCISLDDFLGAR